MQLNHFLSCTHTLCICLCEDPSQSIGPLQVQQILSFTLTAEHISSKFHELQPSLHPVLNTEFMLADHSVVFTLPESWDHLSVSPVDIQAFACLMAQTAGVT